MISSLRLIVVAAALAVLPFLPPRAGAVTDTGTTPQAQVEDLQIIVMEAPGCIYCSLFRRDVLPSYEASTRARTVPVRFLDVNDLEKAQLDLTAPVDIVPTFVVVKDKRELGRVPGYIGPETFFHALNHILGQAP